MKIVTFLWKRVGKYQLPNVCNYTAEHVNVLEHMLKRHLHIDHELICITDMPEGVNCRTIPLWDKCRHLGGCYNRLYMYSKDMKELIGDRFAWIDLDCVIVDDVTPVFTMKAPFIIHRYEGIFKDQRYNGAFGIMNAGVHDHVWEDFDPVKSPDRCIKEREEKKRIGSDQAWVSLKVPYAKTVGNEHGLYEAARIGATLPSDARMVFFAGKRDPSENKWTWVREHYY